MLVPAVIFAGAALAAGSCFALAFLSENSHLVPDFPPLADLLYGALAALLGLVSRSGTVAPVALAASLPAVYFCAASGRWRDRETKRFAKGPAAL